MTPTEDGTTLIKDETIIEEQEIVQEEKSPTGEEINLTGGKIAPTEKETSLIEKRDTNQVIEGRNLKGKATSTIVEETFLVIERESSVGKKMTLIGGTNPHEGRISLIEVRIESDGIQTEEGMDLIGEGRKQEEEKETTLVTTRGVGKHREKID